MIGYCVGGTLLAVRSATWRRRRRLDRQRNLLRRPDRLHRRGRPQGVRRRRAVEEIEEQMTEQGYLEGAAMAKAFNMLAQRPHLVVCVNNYLKGKEPMPFDLWYGTRTRRACRRRTIILPAPLLLRTTCRTGAWCWRQDDRPEEGDDPVYELAAEEDHIAPEAAFNGAKCLGRPGPLRPGGLRPHRRRRRPARQAEIPVLDQRPARANSRTGSDGERDARLLVAGLDRWVDGAGAGRSRRASPATAS